MTFFFITTLVLPDLNLFLFHHQPYGSFPKKKDYTFNNNAIHFLDERKFISYGWKIQWVVVSYEWKIWWVISYKCVSYRKGLRVCFARPLQMPLGTLYNKVLIMSYSTFKLICTPVHTKWGLPFRHILLITMLQKMFR